MNDPKQLRLENDKIFEVIILHIALCWKLRIAECIKISGQGHFKTKIKFDFLLLTKKNISFIPAKETINKTIGSLEIYNRKKKFILYSGEWND